VDLEAQEVLEVLAAQEVPVPAEKLEPEELAVAVVLEALVEPVSPVQLV